MKKAVHILVFFAFCILYKFANATTTIPGGTLSSAHFTLAGSPYNIMGHIIVADKDSLVIDPGVVVEFQGKYKLFCNGKILANGTPSQHILFTVPTALQSTGWLGIRYDNTPVTNGQSSFKYCTIEYGRADIAGDDQGGGMYFNNFGNCIISNTVIQNCYAQYGGGAIFGMNTWITISRDSFYNNDANNGGPGIHLQNSTSAIDSSLFVGSGIMSYQSYLDISNSYFLKCIRIGAVHVTDNLFSGASFLIRNNVFDSCSSSGVLAGGAITIFECEAKVEHNIFKNNQAEGAGGAINCLARPSSIKGKGLFISNNLFNKNRSKTFLASYTPFGGGAISFTNYNGTVINNTIVNNYSDTAGGAIFCAEGSSPSFYNNIIFDNTIKSGVENIFVLDNPSDPNFYHNDVQGGYSGINTNGTSLVGANVNNIDSIPRFTNPAAGIYTLDSISACIDSGTTAAISTLIPTFDLAANPRIAGGFIDMGAYETIGKPASINRQNLTNSISVFPNPANDYFEIKESQNTEIKSVHVFDVLGKQVAFLQHPNSTRFDISNVPSGLLLIKVQCKDEAIQIFKLQKN
jgi:hypothetical protein